MPIAEGILTSIAASLAYDFMKAGGEWLTTKAVGGAQQRALQETFDSGFQTMLRKLGSDGLSQAEITTVSDIFGAFIRQPEIAATILGVAVVGESPDLKQLSERYRQFGGQEKLIGIRFDFDRHVITLLDSVTQAVLSEASQPKSALTNLVLVSRVTANQKSLHQTVQLLDTPPQAQPTYHSCFISYATPDLPFVERLHADLIQVGVTCWFAPQDLKFGDKLLRTIYEAIGRYDKLLVVLSQHSIDSQWVEDEMDAAFDRERNRKEFILFPIRLDDTVLTTSQAWGIKVRQRFIGNFAGWDTGGAYQASLNRLMRDLRRVTN